MKSKWNDVQLDRDAGVVPRWFGWMLNRRDKWALSVRRVVARAAFDEFVGLAPALAERVGVERTLERTSFDA